MAFDGLKVKKALKTCGLGEKVVTLHPLFGVTDDGKKSSPVKLRENDKTNLIIKLTMDLIKVAEEAFATGKKFPEFRSGDTITVAYKIIEGSKERIQLYRGCLLYTSDAADE